MEAAPLIVDIERLAESGEKFVGEIPSAVLELDAQEELIVPSGNICYDLFIQRIEEELLVRGSVCQQFRCTCVRCNCEFEWEGVDPSLVFSVTLGENPFVDLTPEVREGIILTLPNHPLCRTACLGLCSKCGANLNRGPCDCPPSDGHGFGAFDEL